MAHTSSHSEEPGGKVTSEYSHTCVDSDGSRTHEPCAACHAGRVACSTCGSYTGVHPKWCDGGDRTRQFPDSLDDARTPVTECGFCEDGVYRGQPCPYCDGRGGPK